MINKLFEGLNSDCAIDKITKFMVLLSLGTCAFFIAFLVVLSLYFL